MADPNQAMSNKSGDAKIVRSGHTSSPNHGANTMAKAIDRTAPTDERPK